MGYYANFDYDLNSAVVDVKKIHELEEFFADESNDDIVGFYNVKIGLKNTDTISKIVNIDINDTYEKFHDDRLFAEKLSSALVSGYIDLYFTGEDSSHWGYRVEPNRIYSMSIAWVVDDPNYPTNWFLACQNGKLF